MAFPTSFNNVFPAKDYTLGRALSQNIHRLEKQAEADLRKQVTVQLAGRLSVVIECEEMPPKSDSNKQRQARLKGGWPRDVDNRTKSVLDAMRAAGVWLDDSEVVRLVVEKRYGPFDRALIKVEEV
ncbi:RusA family crossover junction endodeoxyribonuclease [Mesorhizobium sp. M0040]|uniref:RusA family crossover junction endodeoxyribonuclease n=1 Tax=Mesorhizobium sp. M0040 TaxID=2956855 RepID=UPI003338F64B